jgi:hypothetical protein
MTARLRPGQRLNTVATDVVYDLSADRQARAKAKLLGKSLGQDMDRANHYQLSSSYSINASELIESRINDKPTNEERASLRSILALKLNPHLPESTSIQVHKAITGLAVNEYIRLRRARPTGAEVDTAIALMDNPAYQVAQLSEADIPY